MNLSELVFTANTTELERASKAIGALVQDMSKVSAASSQMAKTQAQTEEILSRAAKNYAAARKENAKAADQEIKSVIVADKADQAREKSVRKTTAATQESTKAVEKNVSILQRQSDILEFQTQGWSKGQSSILATAKAAGVAAEEMQSLQKVLETQRKLMGGDPFDKSISGLKSLQNQYTELKEAVRQYNTDSNLTAKQTKEIARDKERLIEKMKVEGSSFQDIRSAVRAYNREYVNLAGQYNKLSNAEAEVIKQRKDMVSATNYVTVADQKMAASLSVTNASVDKAGTDLLVKYENALRKSGMAQDVVTSKLATYKNQLIQVQGQEEKRRAQHLARAITPQISDVVVSLWSGQSPFTVLLQQGAQVNDLFQLSGVAAADFGKTVKQAFTSMLPAMATVAKGVGSLIVDSFVSAGTAAVHFTGNLTGVNHVLDILKRGIVAGGEENFKYIASIQKIGTALNVFAGASILGLVALLGSIAIGLKQVIAQENELNRAVALSGGAMGATADIANTYVARLGEITGNSTKANEAMAAMAKAGNITSSSVMMVGEAAIALNKAMGAPIEETVKQFDKLATAPGKTLIEIAKATGLISAETVELVLQYERAGESAKAADLAQKAYATATKSAAADVKENYGTLTTFAMGVSTIFSKMWDTILGVGRSDNLDTRIDQLRERIAENAKATPGLFLTQERIDQDTKDLNRQFYTLVQQRQELMNIGKQKEQNVKATKAEEELDRLRNQTMSSIEKHEQEITRLTNYKLQLKKDGLLTDKAEKVITTAIAAERKKINDELSKNKDKKTESFFDSSMKTLRNNTIEAAVANDGLVESQVKLLQIIKDPAFAKMAEIQKIQVMQAGAAAIATEQQAEAVKQLEKAEEFRLKVLGKSEGVGKQYYSDMEALMKYAKTAGWTTEQVEEMTRALYMQTPAWKEHEKALESSRQALNKFNEESIAYQSGTTKTNEELDYRISLLGKTSEQQKILSIEYQREQKLRENAVTLGKKLRDIEEGITRAKKDGLSGERLKKYEDAKVQAIQDSAERERAINRETAVAYAEDLQKEIDAIKSSISDSIVTALFEGGKEGSKKLRQVLVDTLRKKVTVVVDAVVNTLLGNVIGSLMGGSAAQAGSSLLGSAASSAAGSMLGGALGSLGAFGGAVSGFGTAALAATQSMLGMTGTVAQMSTSLAAAGHTAAAGMQAGVQAFQAIPGWGWAIAAVGALAAIFGKKSTPHTGGIGAYSAASGATTGSSVGLAFGIDQKHYTQAVEDLSTNVAKSIVGILDATATTFGKQAGYYAATAFADDSSKDGAWGALRIKFGEKVLLDWADTAVRDANVPREFADGEEGMKQYLAAVAVSTRDALVQALRGEKTGFGIAAPRVGGVGWALDMLMALGDSVTLESLAQVVAQINAFKLALDQMSKNLVGFSGITNEVVTALVRASGGVETLLANANTYYENFYSEAERNANILRDVKDALAAVGLGLPTTRDEFRALVEEQMALGESGATAVAALLGVSGAFASVIQPVDQLEESLKSISDSVINEINRLRGFTSGGTSSIRGLEQEFNRLTSNARQGGVGSFEKLANVSQLLEETYKATSGSEVEYMLRKAILANSLEQSYNSIKTTGVTLDSSAAIMGPPSLNAPVVNSIGSTMQEDSVGMLNAMQTLINEVSLLRAEVRADVSHNAKTAKILERVTPDGNSFLVETA
jgi:phage-related minor tail protein